MAKTHEIEPRHCHDCQQQEGPRGIEEEVNTCNEVCQVSPKKSDIQWLFLVPLKGGIGGIVHPPIGRKNATYIPLIYCLLGGYMLPTTF